MALLDLVFGGPKNAKIGSGSDDDLLTIDASLSETHDRTSKITENEIEDGSKFSDHVSLDPISVTLEGIISDTPISTLQSAVGAGASFLSQRVGGELLGAAVAAGAGFVGQGVVRLLMDDRSAQEAFKFFEELWSNREPITLVTALRRYDNMVIESLSVPRSKEVGKALKFTVKLREIKIITSQTTSLTSFVAPSVSHSANSATNVGKQATKNAKQGTADNSTALLKLSKAAGFFGGG